MTQQQKVMMGHILVEGVLLIRKIWQECGDDNKETFKARAAQFVGEIDDSMAQVDD